MVYLQRPIVLTQKLGQTCRYKYWYHTWIIVFHSHILIWILKKAFGSVPIFLWCQSLQASPPPLFPQISNYARTCTIQIVYLLLCLIVLAHILGPCFLFFVWFPWNFHRGFPGDPPPILAKASQGHQPSSLRFGCLWHHRHHPSRLRPAS